MKVLYYYKRTTEEMRLNMFLIRFFIVSKVTYPAFLAHLSGSTTRSPVVFNRVHSGYHHGYSTSTGKFTVDRGGVYVFLHNIEAAGSVANTALAVNGNVKVETRSDGRHSGYDDTSAVTVLELSSGDQVYVNIQSGGEADDGQTLFFGILLFEL